MTDQTVEQQFQVPGTGTWYHLVPFLPMTKMPACS